MSTATEPTLSPVLTAATVQNLGDLWNAESGTIPKSYIRGAEITEAVVDNGTTLISLPKRIVQQLGLRKTGTKRIIRSFGISEADVYEAVRPTIQNRGCTMDVVEVPDDVPTLIGRLPLLHLDLLVDLRNRVLIGNPAHGGEHMYELY